MAGVGHVHVAVWSDGETHGPAETGGVADDGTHGAAVVRDRLNPVVQRVGNVDVSVVGDGHGARTAQRLGPGHRDDLPCRSHDQRNAVTPGVGNVDVAIR